MRGKVYFVGAGPGDPGLLTVRSVDLIKKADVVIYDSLVTDEILHLIPSNVRKIAVRKSPRARGLDLKGICSLVIAFASSGETVVRLKSGDPLIFGRTWEEIEFLKHEDIAYEIIPGITSALSSAAFAEVPLTDRRFSSSFAVVTGHEAENKARDSVDWNSLAGCADTLVVLMGASTLMDYCRRLHDAGVDDSAAVTIVANASRVNQKILKSTIGDIVEACPEDYGDLCTVIINVKGAKGRSLEDPVKTHTEMRY